MFKRFLGRKADEAPPPPPPIAADDDDEEIRGADVDDSGKEHDEEGDWRRRAAAVIPGSASTGSKRPAALYGDDGDGVPSHFVRASGCELLTAGGATLIDCTMALGAVALAYADSVVNASVVEAIGAGTVAGLPPTLEVRVAERLCEVIPCAEQVRFLKTGAEAVAAAVRIARVATGRARVVGCGYFGWHDWASAGAGVPEGASASHTGVPFDDVAALERAVVDAGSDLAAVVLEPVIEREPAREWLEAARRLCDASGAVLIFDELKTGFRIRTGGYQDYVGIHPDLATFGKAMANGFPLAAVVGRAGIMESAARTWISSTLAAETVGLAAADAVLDWHERAEVCESLWSTGEEMRGAVERAIAASGAAGVDVQGIAPMWFLRFADSALETAFLRRAVTEGVLFKRGAYNFSCLAHDEEAIGRIEFAASTALVALAEDVG